MLVRIRKEIGDAPQYGLAQVADVAGDRRELVDVRRQEPDISPDRLIDQVHRTVGQEGVLDRDGAVGAHQFVDGCRERRGETLRRCQTVGIDQIRFQARVIAVSDRLRIRECERDGLAVQRCGTGALK